MKLSNLAQRNYAEPGRIAYNAAMYLAVEPHNNKEMLVCRPHPHLVNDDDYMKIFRQQGMVTENYTHEHVLRYQSFDQDDRGPFWYMSPGKYISLARLMVEKPSIRLDEKWTEEAIDDLMNIIEYVNTFQHLELELTPNSVLVTKGAKHTIAVMPPLTDFLAIKDIIWQDKDESIAPEVYNIEQPTEQADIYGIARIIQYLYSYTSIPFRYEAIVKSATGEKVGTRPVNIKTMRNTIETRKKTSSIISIAISIAVVFAFFAFVLFYPWSDDTKPQIVGKDANPDSALFDDGALTGNNSNDPLVNTDITSATQAEKDRMLDEYMHDSSYMSMDTAESLSPEMKAHQRKMMQMAADKFRSAFKIQARAILEKVYAKENMKSQDIFLRLCNEANIRLIDLQQSLGKQYQIDPTTSTRISAEVTDEIVAQLKKKW